MVGEENGGQEGEEEGDSPVSTKLYHGKMK